MRIEEATFEDIVAVAQGMRASDLREFSALLPVHTREEMAHVLAERYGARTDLIVARVGDTPIAIGATVEARPNVVTLLFYATDRFREVAVPLTRFIRRELFPRLEEAGVHRIECVSIEGHTAAHRWIQLLGLEVEAVCRGYGKNGETFLQFAWISDVVSSARD